MNQASWTIQEIKSTPSLELFSGLVDLLQDAVASGASIGFLAPLSTAEARNYWMAALEDVGRGDRVILLALQGHDIIGCVQLLLASRPNARHRADVQKLIVHRRSQGRGVARALLAAIEKVAQQKGRSLLIAETRQGAAGERLYAGAGYTLVGAIPRFQRGADGSFDATAIFYRNLETNLETRAAGR